MPVRIANLEKTATEHGPSSLKRIDYLDGWRGLAIACVLQGHFLTIGGFLSGRLGVDIFFCLSGLLMARLLFIKRTPLLIFYERRISRIFPVFFLYLFTIYLFAIFSGKSIEILEVLSTATSFRTYYPAFPDILINQVVPTGHLWSLYVEEHSYLFMSILTLIAIIRKREVGVLLCVGFLAMIITKYYASLSSFKPVAFAARTECAASYIMISAGYSLIKDRLVRFVVPVMPVISLFLAVFCYTELCPFWSARVFCAPVLLAFTVNHLSEACEAMIKVLRFRPLRLLGLWSYSIYLWQQPFFVNRQNLHPGVALALAVTVGIISFYAFENPTRRWLNERKYLVWFKKNQNSNVT